VETRRDGSAGQAALADAVDVLLAAPLVVPDPPPLAEPEEFAPPLLLDDVAPLFVESDVVEPPFEPVFRESVR